MSHRAIRKTLIFCISFFALLPSTISKADVFEDTSYKGQKTKVRYALFGGAGEQQIAGQIAGLFIAENPDVCLEINVYPWAQYWTKLQVQAASGLAPDVITLYSENMGVWIEQGALLEIDKYIQSSEVNFSDYYSAALEVCRWKNIYYTMPIDISARTVAYSVDRLQERGIPREKWPRADKPLTWQEFKDLSKSLTLRNADGTFAQYGFGIGQMWNQTMYRMYGGSIFDRQVNPQSSTAIVNDDLSSAVCEVFKMQYADRTALGFIGLASGAFDNLETLLISPKFGMCTTGPWALASMKEAGVNFGLTPMPRGTSPAQLIHVNSLGIYRFSKNPDAAWRFIKFATSKPAQDIIGRKLKNLPALIASQDAFVNNDLGIKGCEAFLYDMPISHPSETTSNAFLRTEITKFGQRLEQDMSEEYEKRMSQLPRNNGKISEQDYADFVAGMGKYIDAMVPVRLQKFDENAKKAFARANMPAGGIGVKYVYPAILFCAFVFFVLLYFRNIGKSSAGNAGGGFRRNNKAGYFFISPWLIGFICLSMLPILASIVISFTQWNMIMPPKWVGMRNYIHLIGDEYFILGLSKTFKYALLVIPISLIGGLFTAGLLTCNIKFSGTFKAIFYFPSLFTGAAAAVLWFNMFNKDYGIINHILSYLGIEAVNWIDATHAFYAVVLMNFFWIGSAMIIYYAGMKQIPRSYYEAADVDGAGPVRKFIYITIPILSPVIMFTVIINTIGAFQVFTPALFFAQDSSRIGEPGDSLRFYAVNIYNEAFNSLRMGNACTYAIILFILIFAITMIQLKISKKFVHTD
ncbi:MAG: extracellular solute-binding protein [Phycisphaerae bacterium]|jgi:multiple sugar transport system permease protein